MADFVQTMKKWKRMCNAMCQDNEYTACDKCDLRYFGCPAIYEKECDNADWDRVEKVVVAWAAEHPEPVYPMWCEWLADKGVVDVARMPVDYSGGIVTEIKPSGKMYEPIPADIAQKLGIEPKEG